MMKLNKTLIMGTGVLLTVGLLGTGAEMVKADSLNLQKLTPAEIMPTSPEIKKGQKVFVTIKDTPIQSVTVYNQNAKKTDQTVKMGSEFTAKDVKRVHGLKLVKVNNNQWLNTKDVVQD